MPICEKALLCSAWLLSCLSGASLVSFCLMATSPELFCLYSGCLSRTLSQRGTVSAWFDDDLLFICHCYFVSLLRTNSSATVGPSLEGQSRPLREIISRETSKELW